ncbi:hypothetical protein [Radicibacter daui]|uniref:hypothetical protein n=1 Tax=Radicibacter daui TaxID=3064829 RepID=UPI004046B35F
MIAFIPELVIGHSLVSIIALVAGVPVLVALARGKVPAFWTWLFLITSIATSASGYLFPFHFLMPSHIIGAVALIILAGVLALHFSALTSNLAALLYAAGMVASFYLNAFVAVAQAFGKIAALRALAPTQSEPPFAIAELTCLIVFIIAGVVVTRGFIRRRPLGVTLAQPAEAAR